MINSYKEFNVGDIITTCDSGFFRLTAIEPRKYLYPIGEECTPLFHYERILHADFKQGGYFRDCCDSSHCQKITKEVINQMLETYREGLNKLLNLIKS